MGSHTYMELSGSSVCQNLHGMYCHETQSMHSFLLIQIIIFINN